MRRSAFHTPKAYFTCEANFTNPEGIYFVDKRTSIRKDAGSFVWRRHPDLNRGIADLQSAALPLGYGAVYIKQLRAQIKDTRD